MLHLKHFQTFDFVIFITCERPVFVHLEASVFSLCMYSPSCNQSALFARSGFYCAVSTGPLLESLCVTTLHELGGGRSHVLASPHVAPLKKNLMCAC